MTKSQIPNSLLHPTGDPLAGGELKEFGISGHILFVEASRLDGEEPDEQGEA